MLEWLLPALAVAQLAARKTWVSACACSVSLFTTTCALCVARLRTRRRWLFVSPFLSLIVRCEPIHHCLRDFPLSPCHTRRTYRSSANGNRTHIHCATVQYEVIPTTAPLLLFILPPKVTPLGDSTSVVGSSTPNTACSKVCKSCPVRANSNSLGKFHRVQHRAQQSLGSVARCQKTANLSLPRLTR
jgi:hypothetical protein